MVLGLGSSYLDLLGHDQMVPHHTEIKQTQTDRQISQDAEEVWWLGEREDDLGLVYRRLLPFGRCIHILVDQTEHKFRDNIRDHLWPVVDLQPRLHAFNRNEKLARRQELRLRDSSWKPLKNTQSRSNIYFTIFLNFNLLTFHKTNLNCYLFFDRLAIVSFMKLIKKYKIGRQRISHTVTLSFIKCVKKYR
jgi:hypothetical protein